MSKPSLRIFGPRVAIIETEEELEGSIQLPQNRAKLTSIGLVTHLGDGKSYIPNKTIGTYALETEDIIVKEGDIVMYQMPMMMASGLTYEIGNKPYLFLLQSDIIAVLSKLSADINSFKIAGRYILCTRHRREKTRGGIVLPDVAEDFNDEMNKFSVIQVGSLVKKCKVGESVVVDRTRANEFQLLGSLTSGNCDVQKYYFIDEQAVHGIIDSE